MRTPQQQVEEFHNAFGAPVADRPGIPPEDRVELRKKLIDEEWTELQEAIEEGDIFKIAKEWADLQYVVSGFALEFGIPEEVFKEVHNSNMSKLGEDGKPILREDGKILKGPGYYEPDLQGALWLFK